MFLVHLPWMQVSIISKNQCPKISKKWLKRIRRAKNSGQLEILWKLSLSGLFFEVFETKVFNFTDSLMIIITNQAENRCLPKVFRLQPPFCLLFGSFQQFWFFAQNYPVLWTLHWTAGACANLNQFCRSNTAVINDNYYHRLWILGKQIII